MKIPVGIVDYISYPFTTDRRPIWDDNISSEGSQVKIRRDPADSFCEPQTMIARMDELGIATLVIPTGDVHDHGTSVEYDPVTARLDEMDRLAAAYPGRFAAWWSVNPQLGWDGVRRAEEVLASRDWVVGLWTHTHSFDRTFDHPDYYPFYALCAGHAVPFAMQAGTSGGRLPSACGQPIRIDRPAIYFRSVNFLLSHTGWPWVAEAVAMALKFPNVYLGTGAYPPKHWDAAVHTFLRGPGKSKTLFGTNFPTVGHRHALGQIELLDMKPEVRENLLRNNALRLFSRLESESE